MGALGKSSELSDAAPLKPIILADGASIQAWVKPGAGTPLLFLYGLGCSNAHWKYQVNHFQQVGRLTIELDFRGHGASTIGNPNRPLTLRTLSQDVKEVLAVLGVGEVIVLGQSMGGSIAMQLAHDEPDLIKAMILQGSPGRDPFAKMRIGLPVQKTMKILTTLNRVAPKWTRFFNRTVEHMPHITRELVRLKGFNASLARSDDIDEYIANFFSADPNIFYELAEDLADFNVSQLGSVIECPTLILAGAKDQIVPLEECRWLAKRLGHAELDIIPHGSHCPHLDDPNYVNGRIERFLKTYQP